MIAKLAPAENGAILIVTMSIWLFKADIAAEKYVLLAMKIVLPVVVMII